MASLAIVLMATCVFFLATGQTPSGWVVPDKYKTLKNPTPANKENTANGKDLYAKHCKSCHGVAGLGDGPKAATLGEACGDFSTAKFQGQTDGEIFYKVTEGKGKMPSFKKTIPEDNDRWNLVLYMRSFKSK